jgi:glycosyltransferase involved in cell wall biosynthesis
VLTFRAGDLGHLDLHQLAQDIEPDCHRSGEGALAHATGEELELPTPSLPHDRAESEDCHSDFYDARVNLLRLPDIVLIPTFAHEGSMLTAVEAMSLSLPVVCTNEGGPNNVVCDRWMGLVVLVDLSETAEGLARLSWGTKLHIRLGAEARREAAFRFTVAAREAHVRDFAYHAGWVGDRLEGR